MIQFTIFLAYSFNIPAFIALIVVLLFALVICMKISKKYHLYERTDKRNKILRTKKELEETWGAKEGQQAAG